MKCAPDNCPIVTFSDLTAAEQREQRARKAKEMFERGFTEQQIAKQFGVGQATISRDLGNLFTVNKSKPSKTSTNPKGAGRPKGSKKSRTRIYESPRGAAAAVAMLDQGKTRKEIAAETGLGETSVRMAAERERGRREAEPTIMPDMLSMTAQEKLDTAIRQHKRRLDIEFEARVLAECKERLDSISLPHYAKQLAELERSISSRKGIMDRITYRKILSCLHPDRVPDTALKKRYEEAFRLFTELEKRVLDEKESPTQFRKMPRTYEELMAMKAKVQADRRAKRVKVDMSVR